MALNGTLAWLCSLAVLSSSVDEDENVRLYCSSQTHLLANLTADLRVVETCGENLPWSAQETAALLSSVRNLTDTLHKHQLKECHGAEPKECPEAEVPNNGGLVCATVANKRYCKPMCNYGYDFGFLRRSRLYEECSEQKGYRWDTQYVGGNKLAVCDEASTQVSGAKTAYFPKYQDCLTTKSSSQLQNSIIENFANELKNKGVQGEPQYACLVCG